MDAMFNFIFFINFKDLHVNYLYVIDPWPQVKKGRKIPAMILNTSGKSELCN